MKLLERYNRINLLSTSIIFVLAGIAFYIALHFTLLRQMDEDLEIEQHEIINFVKVHDSLPHPVVVKDQQIYFEQTNTPYDHEKFNTIKVPHDKDDYREIRFSIKAGNQWYNASVSKSLEGTELISRAVFLITICTITLIFITSFFINQNILKKLWQPFYQSLDSLQQFKVGNQQPLKLPATRIDEFNFMNVTLERSTEKALQDYNALKVFTENASHELQTPLAIIRSKLEVLMQDEQLSEHQFGALESATDALNRLSRMNQSLVLLTRIENEQFATRSMISLDQLIIKKTIQFKELWEDKHLSIHTDIDEVSLLLNKELMEILLNNLFSNATRHNIEHGEIFITFKEQQLIVRNTGSHAALDKIHLFQRFSSGNGLGLALIRQICDASGLSVSYEYENGYHLFKIFSFR